jgi:hypothetical protein
MLGLEVFVVEYSNDTRVKNIIGIPSKAKIQQIFSNLRQNQQYNLPQVGHLRGNSIFPFA